jgi:malate permease and related proteins
LAPAVAWLLTLLLGIDGLTRAVLILQTSTPAAVLPLLYALRFGTRPDLVAGAIFVTTLLSALSLTVLLYLLQMFS